MRDPSVLGWQATRRAALLWLQGKNTREIAISVGRTEAAVYNRMDEIRALACAMRNPPPDGGERRAA